MKRLNAQEAAHFAETVREMNSDDSAYQHMLDTIADDIDAEFCGDKVCAFRVSEFVRKWSPSNGGKENMYDNGCKIGNVPDCPDCEAQEKAFVGNLNRR